MGKDSTFVLKSWNDGQFQFFQPCTESAAKRRNWLEICCRMHSRHLWCAYFVKVYDAHTQQMHRFLWARWRRINWIHLPTNGRLKCAYVFVVHKIDGQHNKREQQAIAHCTHSLRDLMIVCLHRAGCGQKYGNKPKNKHGYNHQVHRFPSSSSSFTITAHVQLYWFTRLPSEQTLSVCVSFFLFSKWRAHVFVIDLSAHKMPIKYQWVFNGCNHFNHSIMIY